MSYHTPSSPPLPGENGGSEGQTLDAKTVRAGATATTKINRKDYGIVWNKVLDGGGLVVGEEISITLEIEGIVKK